MSRTTSKARAHHDGRRFRNPDGRAGNGLLNLLRWHATSQRRPWPRSPVGAGQGAEPAPGPGPAGPGLAATFIGQSTFLLQWEGLNLLTDPVFSDRVGPWNLGGPRRVRPPGLPFAALPCIDAVLVSHNHYDHLDVATLLRLRERYDPLIVTTLGNERFLRRKGFRKVVELDWWQEHAAPGGFHVQALPAQHFSSRHLFDRNRTLWAGFQVRAGGCTVYFAGDTGYGGHFQEIARRTPSPDLALIPIGAYEPRWFMRRVHVNPAEAVQVHLDLRPRLSIGMHFGTFQLTDEPIDAPPADLRAALRERGVPESEFLVPEFGRPIHVPHPHGPLTTDQGRRTNP